MAARATKKTTRRAKGDGCLYQDAKGIWNVQLDLGRNVEGKRIYKRIRRKTQAEALAARNEFLFQRNLGVAETPAKQTLGEFLDAWLRDTIKPHKEAKTYRVYEQIVRLYLKPQLGSKQLGELRATHVQAAINRLSTTGGKPSEDGKPTGLSAKTVRDIKGVLSSAISKAPPELLWIKLAPKVATPKMRQKEAVYLSASEAAALIEKSEDNYLGPLITIALMTGLRLGEATGLTWEDIDLESSTLRVRRQLQREAGEYVLKGLKTKSSTRTLSLPEDGVAVLREQQKRQKLMVTLRSERGVFNPMKLVFTSSTGKPLSGGQVDDDLKALCALAGVQQVSFHKLRHTAATHMAAAGVPMNVVKDQLGHSTYAITANTYSHAVPGALQQASDTLGRILRDGKAKL